MLIGLGHDLQALNEFQKHSALREKDFFFNSTELAYCEQKSNSLQSLAGIFAAKEAFYKALPISLQFFWTDIDLQHHPSGQPYFKFYGSLNELIEQHQWKTHVSISHSGDYASAVVMLSQPK